MEGRVSLCLVNLERGDDGFTGDPRLVLETELCCYVSNEMLFGLEPGLILIAGG